jgi:hydrogenase maturation factor
MEPVQYKVLKINGDYAIMVSDSGVENTVAMALLPMEIAEGDTVLWENFEYRILK